MRKTKLLVSPSDIIGLEALNYMANEKRILDYNREISLFARYLSAMFQAGINQFESSAKLLVFADESLTESNFVLRHTTELDHNLWWKFFWIIDGVLLRYRPQIKAHGLANLQGYLANLLYASMKNVCVGYLYDITSFASRIEHTCPDLSYMLKDLLSGMSSYETTSPIPVTEISFASLGRFMQLCASDLFNEYTETTAKLDDINQEPIRAISQAEQVGIRLCRKYRRSLIMHRIMIQVTEASAAISGILDNKVMKIAGDQIKRILSQREPTTKRIVTYHFGKIALDIFTARFFHALEMAKPATKEGTIKFIVGFFKDTNKELHR